MASQADHSLHSGRAALMVGFVPGMAEACLIKFQNTAYEKIPFISKQTFPTVS